MICCQMFRHEGQPRNLLIRLGGMPLHVEHAGLIKVLYIAKYFGVLTDYLIVKNIIIMENKNQ